VDRDPPNGEQEMEKVIFLPGVITPAAIVYGPLVEELKGEIQPILKDLELYAADEPPADYGLHVEIEGILSVMAQEGLESAHFVAYSGGAATCLAFTAAYPQRVKSLAMFEPATIPAKEWMQSEAGAAEWARCRSDRGAARARAHAAVHAQRAAAGRGTAAPTGRTTRTLDGETAGWSQSAGERVQCV
jgi:pimeloyl-ACP methyl ester carboxylesterase